MTIVCSRNVGVNVARKSWSLSSYYTNWQSNLDWIYWYARAWSQPLSWIMGRLGNFTYQRAQHTFICLGERVFSSSLVRLETVPVAVLECPTMLPVEKVATADSSTNRVSLFVLVAKMQPYLVVSACGCSACKARGFFLRWKRASRKRKHIASSLQLSPRSRARKRPRCSIMQGNLIREIKFNRLLRKHQWPILGKLLTEMLLDCLEQFQEKISQCLFLCRMDTSVSAIRLMWASVNICASIMTWD